MKILCIETSTNICSAAISIDGKCSALLQSSEGNHAEKLPVFIDQLLKANTGPLQAVAISQGPGSYTGLRIGTATAKGVCYGLNIPLIAIDTLQIMASAAINKLNNENALLCPMIDARRMEVYCALYDRQLKRQTDITAEIITADSFARQLNDNKIYFFGNGADKCKPILISSNAAFIDGITPNAEYMCSLAEVAFLNRKFEDTAYFDPFYLKEYQAIVSKNKIINL